MKNKSIRLLIVGGVAAGASAAARARRLSETAQITVIERGPDVSFANCGLPYHIGGEISDRSRLALQTPQSLAQLLNITVRNHTEAIRIDRERKVLIVRSAGSANEEAIGYDKLLLAPGASALKPPLPGIDSPQVHTLRNLQDMDAIKAASRTANKVLVIGAGFIGLEMAEQLKNLGKQVTLVEASEHVLPQMDAEMVLPIEAELRARGIELITQDGLTGFTESVLGISAQLHSGRTLSADFAVLSIGVRAESKLAAEAGLELGSRGTIAVNQWMQTSDPAIYAAGDVIESVDRIFGQPMNLPLGGPANRQGRLVADHIFTPQLARPYPGHLGTAIVRVFDQTAGMTGWTQKRLAAANTPYQSTIITDFQHASYFPGALPLTLKLLWNPEDGKLLGAQAYGIDGVDKRLDVLSTALAGGLCVDDLADLELAYAPPFGNARDVVNIAGFTAQNQLRELVRTVSTLPKERRILDLRPTASAQARPIENAVNIPLAELRNRLAEIDSAVPWVAVCAVGKSSYFAARILSQNGMDAVSLSGGLIAHKLTEALDSANTQPRSGAPLPRSDATPSRSDSTPPSPEPTAPLTHNLTKALKTQPNSPTQTQAETIRLDCSGMSCPGPLMRVKEGMEALGSDQILEVCATDPGFAKDVEAFCRACDHQLLGLEQERGVTTARIAKSSTLATPTHSPADPATPISEQRRKGATIVVFSGELDKVMASLVIANGAAMLGGKVTLFFTFWGINALRKEQRVSVKNKKLLDRMFGWMLPRGLGKLPLSKMHFGGIGSLMMKHQMASKNLPNLPGLLGSAKLAGIRLVACTMAMEAMGIREEELIDGVELGGVTDYLESAEKSGTNLFV